ncbi:uncharacterized protein DFL_000410 [Arthrobotrys flagrans]|uniref:Uncharacterized protein n=1 Tax=Arthrobotrys flagrans TaxID=97331 RepID=A0A437ADP5_ARTFL|nr:hypothetical protein DFL_000410 [Arthrobotrys flagrans]
MPQALLPAEAVALGRFVTNKKSPAEEFFDSGLLSDNVRRSNVLVTLRNNFREVLRYTSGTSARSTLTTIVSSHSSFETLGCVQMESLVNKTYQLENSTAVFESICEDPGARKWLIKMIGRGRSIHMVVGFETIIDARVSFNNHQIKERGGEITAPVSSALTAALAVPFPLTDVLDVGAGVSETKGCEVDTSFSAPGEMIFAVQYRKLEFSWLSSKDIDKATLRKSRWRINIGVRSLEKLKENDVIDARLEADSPDAEGEELEGAAEVLDIKPLGIQLLC